MRDVIEAKVIQVIQTIHTEGAGTKEDPKRVVNSYWSLEGDLLAANDPAQSGEEPIRFDKLH